MKDRNPIEQIGDWVGSSFARWFRRNYPEPAPEIFYRRDLREAYEAGVRAQSRYSAHRNQP